MLFDYQLVMQNLFPILPELIITVCMLLVIILDLIQENSKWLFKISVGSLLSATICLLIQLYSICNGFKTPLQIDGFSIAFRTILTLSSAVCILVSVEYIQRAGMQLAEFLIFVLTATIGGMFLCGANDLITIFVSLECLSLSSYLLAGYSKKDVRSNEAAMKYLLMGGASSSVLAYGFSWIYGLSGGEVELTKLVSAVTNHTVDSQGVWISFICILVGIGFKVAAVPFHQWTPDVYEGVRFVISNP